MTSTNPWSLTISEAHNLLINKKLSSVELTQSVLKRIEDTEEKLNAFVTITSEYAMESAKHADKIIESFTPLKI